MNETTIQVIVFAIAIVLPVLARVFAGRRDRPRIREYIEKRGGELIDLQWNPFGHGWYGDASNRIYDGRYRDQSGNTCLATFKTSRFAGVYATRERIVKPTRKSTTKDLETENERLRQRIAKLEGRQVRS